MLGDVAAEVAAAPETAIASSVGPLDPVYMLYTSGSTGAPKAVLMPHRALVNLVEWQDAQTPAAGKRTLARSSIAFDVGFQEVFSTLCFGGTLVVASETERSDVASLHRTVGRHKIARIFLPPVSLQQMAESSNSEGNGQLETVIVAGERLRVTAAIVRFFRSERAKLINHYGPTETHVASSHVLDGSPLRWPQFPPIGRPIANARIYVLDAGLRPCPIGVSGELYIGGTPVAVGYFGRPALTASRFQPDPFNTGGTMYRTGDIARLRSDGELEFIGRADEQVKLRGYRIELGDIEANAMVLQGVRLAVAKLWGADPDEYLALYVLLEEAGPSADEIRTQLRQRLPEHMVPSARAIVPLSAFPLTATGKIDKLRLPPLNLPRADSGPAERLEDQLGQIWSRRIRAAAVGRDDDFLDIGGHSLVAIQIVSEVNDRFGIAVPLSTLLRGGTLGSFTRKVDEFLKAKGMASEAFGAGTEQVVLPDGREVFAVSVPEAEYLWKDVFEQRPYDRNGITLGKGDVVVDVGANIGLFTIYALERIHHGRVISIEPATETFAVLARNLAPYGARVTLVAAGCADVDDPEAAFPTFPPSRPCRPFSPIAPPTRSSCRSSSAISAGAAVGKCRRTWPRVSKAGLSGGRCDAFLPSSTNMKSSASTC